MLKSLPENVISVITNYSSAVWLSCCKDGQKPMIARLSSIRIVDSDTVCCYVPARFFREPLIAIKKDHPVAVLAACVYNFESYQLKGTIEKVYDAETKEVEEQQVILEKFAEVLVGVGFSSPYFLKAYTDDSYSAVIIKVQDIFEQTPKHGTGFKVI